MLTKHNLFKPSEKESKAATTTTIANGIIAAETSARDAKTKRLRDARLQREEREHTVKAPKPGRKASARKRTKT